MKYCTNLSGILSSLKNGDEGSSHRINSHRLHVHVSLRIQPVYLGESFSSIFNYLLKIKKKNPSGVCVIYALKNKLL